MEDEFILMKKMGILKKELTLILDHTDGCCGQYRSTTALLLMSLLSVTFMVTIDRMIHAPAHGKGKVDGLAAVTKCNLLECTRNAKKWQKWKLLKKVRKMKMMTMTMRGTRRRCKSEQTKQSKTHNSK